VGVRRTAAIIIGLVGVVLIVKPAPQSFTVYEAFALTIVLSLAVRDIITRRIPAKVPTLIVALANAVFVTVGGILLVLTQVPVECAVHGSDYLIRFETDRFCNHLKIMIRDDLGPLACIAKIFLT